MKTKTIIILVVIALLILGAWYFTTRASTKIECNSEEDCKNIAKCQYIECTCYQGKCETGYISVSEDVISEDFNLQNSDDTFSALDESIELLE
jgi:regulatory protein YycI of two-component signal transduction system YycFG